MGDQALSRNGPHQARDAFYHVLIGKMRRQLDMARDWGFKLPFGLTMDIDTSNNRYTPCAFNFTKFK